MTSWIFKTQYRRHETIGFAKPMHKRFCFLCRLPSFTGGPASSCQSAAFAAVNVFTSPTREAAARAPKSIGLPVEKQLLCQFGRPGKDHEKNI
jgi:hypothetical protein